MSCDPKEARARRRELDVRPVPRHHVILLTVAMVVMGAAVVALPRLRPGPPPDPWALAKLKLSPLHLALGVPKGGAAPARIVLDATRRADIEVIQSFSAVGTAGPEIVYGSPQPRDSLGRLPLCRGGTQVLAIVEVRPHNLEDLQGFLVTVWLLEGPPVWRRRPICASS